MSIYKDTQRLEEAIARFRQLGNSIGLVPTMGALHKGHISLVKKALKQNDLVVVSIFVNPTQFNNKNDLKKYPRTLDKDAKLLKQASNAILVFAPTANDIYESNVKSKKFDFDGLEHEMEGEFRPGHFDGVGTIVKRLLEIVKPDRAYFGEKDFQQLQIIKKLVTKFNIPVKIIGCAIERESDGLAMSSRNTRLKKEYRQAAPFIFKTLKSAKEKFGTKSANEVVKWVYRQFADHPILKLEYFSIVDTVALKPVKRKSNKKTYRAFIAVHADDVRLIDNIALN
ncbi:MAG: pantoate--beta-alanine ligase [Bacteroidia bacterium]|nr:pantoate--beta-alanine ligase [Bacteroidia bacterium]NND10021.1 pantoate--beta-alanine ligase [Flavobacteriaceae bacterium]MBT8310552.1 pantoate--beta-alanine ligase [Bacteroidia bacterium]NNK27520.1 pantoate--beta-alanine ligase [Flavobacteriaceae bacterium]NNL62159.1 pantoate--beta-alanine ligase [Flavobacteriaceae bacterium]